MSTVSLRDVEPADLPLLFEFQQDPDANYMAAFTARDPSDREAFMRHWAKILADSTNTNRAILYDDQLVGSIAAFNFDENERDITYWLGRQFWGKGIVTQAAMQFLARHSTRPLYGRVAFDNLGSQRVLEKCGFQRIGQDTGFAAARNAEIVEYIYILNS